MPADRSGIAGPHWVRYGIAGDSQYLVGEFRETYDQLVINANMVAHMPAAMSQFIAQRLQKPFVIDPQTHAFQHEIEHLLSTSRKSSGQLKRSWKGLVKRYGAPLDGILTSENPRFLRPEDLADDKLVHDFCRRILSFQKDEVCKEIEEGPDAEYIRFLAEEKGQDISKVPLSMLVAPYFFIGGPLQDQWLEVTRRCLVASRQIVNGEGEWNIPLAAQVVVSKEVVSDRSAHEAVAASLREGAPDVILLWIDGFSEHAASPAMLHRYVEFVELLSATGTPVVLLFGGFFSVAQTLVGKLRGKLRAVCHGLEYGESKPVVPVAGGIPVSRFYSNNLHHRLPPRIAFREVKALGGFDSVARFHEVVCGCTTCRHVVQTDPVKEFRAYTESQEKLIFRSGRAVSMEFPTAEAADLCTRHYMRCKAREYRMEWNLPALKNELRENHKKLVDQVGVEYAAHAAVWADVL